MFFGKNERLPVTQFPVYQPNLGQFVWNCSRLSKLRHAPILFALK